jgi:thioredoxin-like negative regulator of GroEL
MVERLILVSVLLVLGALFYQWMTRRQIQQVAANSLVDPLLHGLKSGVPAIVYFTTPMCVPCKTQQQPALSRLQEELGGNIQIIRVDATEDPESAERWGVFSVPTTFVLDGEGKPREVNHGVADVHKLRRQIEFAA